MEGEKAGVGYGWIVYTRIIDGKKYNNCLPHLKVI